MNLSAGFWVVNGPEPLRPVWGLLQAADAPASGVRFVVDTAAGPMERVKAITDGLYDVDAALQNAGLERWANGANVWPYPIGPVQLWDECSPGSTQGYKTPNATPDIPTFGAYTAWLGATCTARTIGDVQAFRLRILTAFRAMEGAAVEKELMQGSLLGAGSPHLSDGDATFPNGDVPTSVLNGIALLEKEIAGTGQLGVIHVPPQVLAFARDHWAVDNTGGVYRTANGNVVIPGAGYATASRPQGHVGGTGNLDWIYATGPIDIRRSEPFVTPDDEAAAFDRGAGGTPNSLTFRAERHYLVTFDNTFKAAVLVNRCATTC